MLATLFLAVTGLIYFFGVQRGNSKAVRGTVQAPTVPGWPLLGNTVGIALHGSDFIHRCRLKVAILRKSI